MDRERGNFVELYTAPDATVQKANDTPLDPYPAGATRRDLPPEMRSGPVRTYRYHPDVWKEAFRLAGGDTRRFDLHDDYIIVRNNPRPGF